MQITNYKLQITKKKLLLFAFMFIVISSVAAPAFAGWTWGDPIVPCGGLDKYGNKQAPCDDPQFQGYCALLLLVQNLIDFVTLGVLPVVGTLLYIVGGFFILLGGASPGMVSRGKSIMWSTTMGIIIILTAWLITNTVIVSLSGGNIQNWNTIQCPFPTT